MEGAADYHGMGRLWNCFIRLKNMTLSLMSGKLELDLASKDYKALCFLCFFRLVSLVS